MPILNEIQKGESLGYKSQRVTLLEAENTLLKLEEVKHD